MTTKASVYVERVKFIERPKAEPEGARVRGPRTAHVELESGGTGTLDLAVPRDLLWANLLEMRTRQHAPVYMAVDPDTKAITEVLVPLAHQVEALTPTAEGVEVILVRSAAPHFLRREHANFTALHEALQSAKESEAHVLVTETVGGKEIIDVRPFVEMPKPREARPLRGPVPPLTLVTPERAQELFDLCSGTSCDPANAQEPCIPFLYPRDGCYARAHEMCRIIIENGVQPGKVWIYGSLGSSLRTKTGNVPECQVSWRYHVAPALLVQGDSADEMRVIDPSLFHIPAPMERWKGAQGDSAARLKQSDATIFYRSEDESYKELDDDYSKTSSALQDFRAVLMSDSAAYGPPPYNACSADIYVRDNLEDTGSEPLASGGISASPDINHFRQALAHPEETLGTMAAENNDVLFDTVEIGQDNYIYVRLHNRGAAAASVDIDAYYSLPSTLPSPSTWNLIGSLVSPPIAQGELRVAGPLVWSNIPPRGHYCFVAVIGNSRDPKPDLSTIHTIDDFYNLIRSRNNATWKNFDVANLFAGSIHSLKFQIRGWPGTAYESDLEIDLSAFAAGCGAELKVLTRLAEGAKLERLAKKGTSGSKTIFTAQAGGQAAIRGMPLKPGDKSEAILELTIPDNLPAGAYPVSARQLVGGKEIGRVTQRLMIGTYPYLANPRTMEVHVSNCEWAAKVGWRHRIPYNNLQDALNRGYNGCAYCLPEYNTG